jgi:hypothetical protein
MDRRAAAGRMTDMRTSLSVTLALTALAAAGCGGQTPAARAPRTYTDAAHGIAVTLPPGWQRAPRRLTPRLTDPREVLSVGTFPLRYRKSGCEHLPTSALEDMRAGDALITLEERGLDPRSTWPDFPPRPSRFGPELGGRSEAAACAPGAHFTDHWFGFTDGDRHFHVLVAFGPNATAVTQRQAWRILDSLRIDPRVRPDWRSSG